jgi:hypothetical protein
MQSEKCKILHCALCTLHYLLVLFVQLMLAASPAELFELEPVRLVLLVLGRHVVALFALGALQNNVISRHKSSSFQHSAVSIQQGGAG